MAGASPAPASRAPAGDVPAAAVLDDFYLTDEELQDSPSRRDGVAEELEYSQRILGCELIQQGGILLKLPQAVMATGQVLLQRFYCKRSLAKYDVRRLATASCWLATKLEENPRKMRDVLAVFDRLEQRHDGKDTPQPLDVMTRRYDDLKAELVRLERQMLREFGFIAHVEHPHKFVLNYLGILEADPRLMQEAWSLVNDSLRTTLCVRFRGEAVACGVIFLAARRRGVPLPESPPWWRLFSVRLWQLEETARCILALYQQPKAVYVPLGAQAEKIERLAAEAAAAAAADSARAAATDASRRDGGQGGESLPGAAGGPGGREREGRRDGVQSQSDKGQNGRDDRDRRRRSRSPRERREDRGGGGRRRSRSPVRRRR